MNTPIILQSDGELLLDTNHEDSKQFASRITLFSRLDETQGRWHTYEIDNLSLWNAAGTGEDPSDIIKWLSEHSQTPLSKNLENRIRNQMDRYGALRLVPTDHPSKIKLKTDRPAVLELFTEADAIPLPPPMDIGTDYAIFPQANRGLLKQYLAREGWPVVDLVGYDEGQSLQIELNSDEFSLRDYQNEAIDAYLDGEESDGGSGVIVLPCGAGKTITGLGLMAEYDASTLIIATHRTARRQWKRELLEKTTLTEDMISEYAGQDKEIKPVTLTTYHMLTYRDESSNQFVHMDLFKRAEWGLIVYDEVHLLPAPVFRATAEIQSRRRLGLTATLVREDERETDVFSLIGPKRYECPWLRLTDDGWISPARCIEVRVPLDSSVRSDYNTAGRRSQYRIASGNPSKLDAIETIFNQNPDRNALIIGYYLDFLEQIADHFDIPLVTGDTHYSDRLDLYEDFRNGDLSALVLSKVGNYSVDLPNADMMIQVSGSFGSRQEEAQRLGRLLRPNLDSQTSIFYNLVSQETVEIEFARHRKLFLLKQGYEYEILEHSDIKEVPA